MPVKKSRVVQKNCDYTSMTDCKLCVEKGTCLALCTGSSLCGRLTEPDGIFCRSHRRYYTKESVQTENRTRYTYKNHVVEQEQRNTILITYHFIATIPYKMWDTSKAQHRFLKVDTPIYFNHEVNSFYVDSYSSLYPVVYDAIIGFTEPFEKHNQYHTYVITKTSLHTAISLGMTATSLLSMIEPWASHIPTTFKQNVQQRMQMFQMILLYTKQNIRYVCSTNQVVLKKVTNNPISEMGTNKIVYHYDTNQNQLVGTGHAGYQPIYMVQANTVPTNKHSLISEEYDYRHDDPIMSIDLKPDTRIRPYQATTLSKIFCTGRARSGIAMLPCGAGKTLIGIVTTQIIKQPTLIFCTSTLAVRQWYGQFQKYTTIKSKHIRMYTADTDRTLDANVHIVITTYHMLAKPTSTNNVVKKLRERVWGLIILDEVQVLPADTFQNCITLTTSKCKLGLTATLVREDDGIETIYSLLKGPRLYEASWMELARLNYIASVKCYEIHCPLTDEFLTQYNNATSEDAKHVIQTMNPTKFNVCSFLIQYLMTHRKDKIIIFGDNVHSLTQYAKRMGNKPHISGETPESEREELINAFKNSPSNEGAVIFMTKIGDNSLDIPDATVGIQISSHYGSRRQEAQRIGRILRPKLRNPLKPELGYVTSMFYTLISTKTKEAEYTKKRQIFLNKQGYKYKTIKSEALMNFQL